MPLNEYVIPAHIITDDDAMARQFDAVTWFINATDQEIQALVEGGWACCNVADRVAEFFRYDVVVRDVFNYLTTVPPDSNVGYECYVDIPAAESWLRSNRPILAERIGIEMSPDIHYNDNNPPPPELRDWLDIIRSQLTEAPEPTTTQGMTDNMTDQQQPTPTPEPAPTELTIGNLNLLFHGDGVELRVAELAHKFTYAEAQKLHGALGAMLIRTDTPENVKRRLNGRTRCPNCAGRLWVLSGGDHIERCDGCKYYRDDYSAALAFLANTPKGRPGAADYEEEVYGVDRGDQITEDDDD